MYGPELGELGESARSDAPSGREGELEEDDASASTSPVAPTYTADAGLKPVFFLPPIYVRPPIFLRAAPVVYFRAPVVYFRAPVYVGVPVVRRVVFVLF